MEESKNTQSKSFEWESLPFFTLLQILRHLSYIDVFHVTQAIQHVHNQYTIINRTPAFKFIFDSEVDLPEILVTHRHIKQIYLNLRATNENNGAILILLAGLQDTIHKLFIKDRLLTTKYITNALLNRNFNQLTELVIESHPEYANDHNISIILNKCPNLQELTYAYGHLYMSDMKVLCNLKTLKLINVSISSVTYFMDTLKRMSNKLTHLEFFNNPNTTFSLPTCTTQAIYEQLVHLTKLRTLKIMAIENNCQYENLDRPTYFNKLTIVTQKNGYLPKLYNTITQIIAEKIVIQEWIFRHVPSPQIPFDTSAKCEQIKNILKKQREVQFIVFDPKIGRKFVYVRNNDE